MDRINTFLTGSLANTIGPLHLCHELSWATQAIVYSISIACLLSKATSMWISLCLLDDLSVVPILPKAGHWGLMGQRKGWRNWRPSVLPFPGKSSLGGIHVIFVNTMIISICGWYAWFLQGYVPKFLALPTAWSEEILSKTMLNNAARCNSYKDSCPSSLATHFIYEAMGFPLV